MPWRDEAKFLRGQAKRLKDIANAHNTELSETLFKMARDMEARANQLEKDGYVKSGREPGGK